MDSVRAGFDVENVNQSKRLLDMQESVNRSVVSKQIKVLFMPNKDNLTLKDIVQRFLKEVVKYDVVGDISPLSWVKKAGVIGETVCFRAEMSSPFWDHFMSKGRIHLSEFNKKNKTDVKLIRGQTMKNSDLENLSLYLRQKIKKYCLDKKMQLPDIIVKGAYLVIKNRSNDNTMRFKSTFLSITLGWDYSDWHGAPIKNLLSSTELHGYENGCIKWGSLDLEAVLQNVPSATGRNDQLPREIFTSNNRKRDSHNNEPQVKRPRSDVKERI
ncbi:hypothetical protein GCK32_013706 [Trichostrongylus colubriformis]|uniref:Uncharacterized protein n=1 Tax=Trichostrongylus colubriformis TaxID=6319 RepID=A0AAN8FFE0_TRICO